MSFCLKSMAFKIDNNSTLCDLLLHICLLQCESRLALVLNLFYQQAKSELLGMKWVIKNKHQNLQIFFYKYDFFCATVARND